jgi:preprotein translocase subunit YajC
MNLTFQLLDNETVAAQNGAASLVSTLLMVVVMGALLYFMIIRPQRKQQKAEAKMRNELQIGDEIITIGGIYGRVVSLKDDSLIIESSGDRSKLQISRSSIAQNLTVHDA